MFAPTHLHGYAELFEVSLLGGVKEGEVTIGGTSLYFCSSDSRMSAAASRFPRLQQKGGALSRRRRRLRV